MRISRHLVILLAAASASFLHECLGLRRNCPGIFCANSWLNGLSGVREGVGEVFSTGNRLRGHRYQVIAAPSMEAMAGSLVAKFPQRFEYHKTKWGKFPDGTDRITIGGFSPQNRLADENVLMLASFHNNDVTLSQFSVMITLLQSFISSLTVVLPFYPVGTMERITEEGQVATANTYAQMFSSLPSCGRPTRLILYDLHTLQNRFYLHGNTISSLQTSIPLLLAHIRGTKIDFVAFPDDGASKRFASAFQSSGYPTTACSKLRREGERVVHLAPDADVRGKHVLVVDDLVQSGGTLFECGRALQAAGAATVSAFVAHGVFPGGSWKRFARGGDRQCFETFYLTNSIPTVTDALPADDVFRVLPLHELIVEDLDKYTR